MEKKTNSPASRVIVADRRGSRIRALKHEAATGIKVPKTCTIIEAPRPFEDPTRQIAALTPSLGALANLSKSFEMPSGGTTSPPNGEKSGQFQPGNKNGARILIRRQNPEMLGGT